MSPEEVRNTLEAALLAAGRPLSVDSLLELLEPASSASPVPQAVDLPARHLVREALSRMAEEYSGRGIELREVASGFRIQVRPEYARRLGRLWAERPARYSRALLETLALIAYRQPVSRAEIESVRGVSISKGTLDLLLEMGFVRLRGRRRTPGRPVTYATTDRFLEHFGLATLYDLPGVQEMKAAGLLDLSLPVGFEVPDPTKASEADDEDGSLPLEDDAPEFAQDFVTEDEG